MYRSSIRVPWIVLVVSVVILSFLCRANAQEPRKSDSTTVRKSSPATPGLSQQQPSQNRSEWQSARHSLTNAPLDASPKEKIGLTLWIVTILDSPDGGKDKSKSNLQWRINNLPTEFASLNDVRSLLDDMKDSGYLHSSRELKMVALDGQSARAQILSDKPQVTGFNQTTLGRTNTIHYRSCGTTVEARPLIDSKKDIQVQVDYSESDIEKSKDVQMTETAFADVITTDEFTTATKLKTGTAVVIQKNSVVTTGAKTGAGLTKLLILGAAIGTGSQPAN